MYRNRGEGGEDKIVSPVMSIHSLSKYQTPPMCWAWRASGPWRAVGQQVLTGPDALMQCPRCRQRGIQHRDKTALWGEEGLSVPERPRPGTSENLRPRAHVQKSPPVGPSFLPQEGATPGFLSTCVGLQGSEGNAVNGTQHSSRQGLP